MMFQTLYFEDIWGTTSADYGISAGIDQGYIIIDFDWSFDMLSYPFSSGAGSGEISIDDLYVSASFKTLIDDGHVTYTTDTQSTCYIGSFGLSITSDDINASLINILVQLVSPFISDYIGDFLGETIGATIVSFINSETAAAEIVIDERVGLDWHSASDTFYTDEYLNTPYTSFFFLFDRDKAEVPFDPPALPEIVTEDAFQMIIALDVFRTAWWCYAQLDYFSNATSSVTTVVDGVAYRDDLTVSLVALAVPELEQVLPLDTVLTLAFSCAYPDVMEPLYSGIYVQTACDLLLSAGELDLFALSAAVGLAEQPIMTNATALGLTFYFHNDTVSEVESYTSVAPTAAEAESLLRCLVDLCVLPFFDDWGVHVSFQMMSVSVLDISEAVLTFQPEYVSVGFEVLT